MSHSKGGSETHIVAALKWDLSGTVNTWIFSSWFWQCSSIAEGKPELVQFVSRSNTSYIWLLRTQATGGVWECDYIMQKSNHPFIAPVVSHYLIRTGLHASKHLRVLTQAFCAHNHQRMVNTKVERDGQQDDIQSHSLPLFTYWFSHLMFTAPTYR